MLSVLTKIHWVPHTKFSLTYEVESDDSGSPFLRLSEILPGLYLTCEEGMCQIGNAWNNGVCLILILNGENKDSSYSVHEYKNDVEGFVYRKIPTFEDFLLELDDYTSNEMPKNANMQKTYVRSIPAEDFPGYDLSQWFPELCLLIEVVVANRKSRGSMLSTCINNSKRLPSVAVYCLRGVSRSATIVIAYIMKRGCCSRNDAVTLVKRRRPVINPNPGFLNQLVQWEKAGYYRVIDLFTASLLACELRNDGCLIQLFDKHVPLILCTNKCSTEREFFGYVLKIVNPSSDDARIFYCKLRDYVISCVSKEIYVDVPMFFGNICEIVTSLSSYSPQFLSCTAEYGECFDDELYFYILKQIGSSGVFNEHSEVAYTLCLFLQSIDTKHFSNSVEKRPRYISASEKPITLAPEGLCLSFPCLPFLTLYASGFLHNFDVEVFLDEGLNATTEKRLFNFISEALRKIFLGTNLGMQNDRAQTSVRGFHENLRFEFLVSDIEIKILQSVASGSTLTNSTKVHLKLDYSSAFVSLCWVRKIASAAIGTRFFFEFVERYFKEKEGDGFTAFFSYALADRFVTWNEVFDVIRSVDETYQKKFEIYPDLLMSLRKELFELTSSGIAVIPE